MVELIVGAIVAAAAVALVLEPLVRGVRAPAEPADDWDEMAVVELEESDSPRIRALLALREIEFDRATGKLSDDDYRHLKQKYSRQALQAIQAESQASESAADAAEAAVERARARARGEAPVCPACGPRPESAAAYCSRCGRSLVTPDAGPRCPSCGAALPEEARFCAACGTKQEAGARDPGSAVTGQPSGASS